jgi:hypothetical protein
MATRELNPKHKREMKRLVRKTRDYFNKTRFYARGHVFLDKVTLAHVSKSLSVADAVMCLIDAGLPEEAFGLSRTMVEVALNLRFITNKYSERRAKRFVDYIARWKMELIRKTLKHIYTVDSAGKRIPQYSKPQLRQMIKDYKKLVVLARKYPERVTSWAGKGGVWKMAKEPDTVEMLEGTPFKWEFDYDWIYFWTSQYVHGTAVSLDSHAVLPLEPFLMSMAPIRGQHTAGLAVFNVGIYLNKILVMAFRALGRPFDASLADRLGDLLVNMSKHQGTKK